MRSDSICLSPSDLFHPVCNLCEWLDGRESEWTPGVGDGQGGLACCESWGRKESDTTERLNWTESCYRNIIGKMCLMINISSFYHWENIHPILNNFKKLWCKHFSTCHSGCLLLNINTFYPTWEQFVYSISLSRNIFTVQDESLLLIL